MAQSDARVILQKVAGVIVAPVPDPVHDGFLEELRHTILDYMHHNAISGLILDLSGVELLDQHDFEGIRKVSECVVLMGAPVVLAAMKPGVAAGLTMLDVDDAWAVSSMSVEAAMELLR